MDLSTASRVVVAAGVAVAAELAHRNLLLAHDRARPRRRRASPHFGVD